MTTSPHKVLIANRGEIAVRIIRACWDYGAKAVAVYADPDAEALHVSMADEAWALPGVSPADTYLNIDALLDIARRSGATMVHPGYGFLSERAEFARAVQAAGLIWVGPQPETIENLGDKVQARKIAMAVGAPLVTGTPGPVSGVAEVLDFVAMHGLPVAIKAAFGGGGRGLKVVWQRDEVEELYHSAVREAQTAFGRSECYVEQYLDRPRHIEAQVIADKQGNVVVLGTRDCSLQRRNQKLVEEAPAPFISDELRLKIHNSARDICIRAGYIGAGTVEYLLSRDGTLSFLEVNTRLQVEHPVTEETTGFDIVLEQLRIAEGLPLSIQETPKPSSHSFEFRINAEDAGKGYLPTPGIVTRFRAPSGPGIRFDSGVRTGSNIPGSYDSLMAKLIVTGSTREQAIVRARRALREFEIEGVASVLPFHRAVMADADFTEQFAVHTRWIETDFAERIEFAPRQIPKSDEALIRNWIELDGRRVQLGLPANWFRGLTSMPSSKGEDISTTTLNNETHIKAPISGVFHSWIVEEGKTVQEGQAIAVMEAMKMEVQVIAHCAGLLKQQAEIGKSLVAGASLGEIT
ncbi:acetyl/propionyl/methylcrotonyl-CoA carboxylase subunit alpha [Serratia sp. UGAL515B_01]|uniref:acetyl/propionyl/methylcrotonyl-CoA carboxylase subunit alpha n=1 Tax=Serratia sp. UGAL515B_01 TaxID=2986763 RepID=UPI0029551F53|nr:biotin carboxylase N-terminal domain-containing protein [Serratia sp. UGAL515B_01]WON75847.1 ATP-grasp domain-containing protein [Serratia sp. UGAL515B_01]